MSTARERSSISAWTGTAAWTTTASCSARATSSSSSPTGGGLRELMSLRKLGAALNAAACGLAVFLPAAAVFQACSPPRTGKVIVLCAGDSLTEPGDPRHLKRLLEMDGGRARALTYGRRGNTSGEYLRF